MKSIVILVSVAISHVSALPLGSILGGDLTGGLLGDASGASLGLPGLTDGDLVSPLLDSTLDGTGIDVLGGNRDVTSIVGDLLDPNALDLGLLKRETNGLPPIRSLTNLGVDSTSHLDIVDALLHGDALARLGYPRLGHGLAKRLLADVLVKRGISVVSTPGKRYILSNGIGGQLGTGVIGVAGNLQHIGADVIAVGGAGASGHIGRDLGNGSAGQVGAGVVAAAGSLEHIGGGSLSVGGLGGEGHVGR